MKIRIFSKAITIYFDYALKIVPIAIYPRGTWNLKEKDNLKTIASGLQWEFLASGLQWEFLA